MEADIKAELLNLCSDLASVSSTCQTYVNGYFDVIYQLALSYLVRLNLACVGDVFLLFMLFSLRL